MLIRAWLLITACRSAGAHRGLFLGQPLKRRGLVVWAGFHPPVTALVPISRENVDKVLHLNLPPLRRLLLTRSSWLLFVALGGTDASLLSVSHLTPCSSERQYLTAVKCRDSAARLCFLCILQVTIYKMSNMRVPVPEGCVEN